MTRARRERLILDNMQVVRKIARQVSRKFAAHLRLEDFEADGYVGLCTAARRCRKVSTFPQFAYFAIRGAMITAHRRKAYREDLNPSLDSMASTRGSEQLCLESHLAHESSGDTNINIGARDLGPLPDELAARRELEAFAAAAIALLPEDERFVIGQALGGVKLVEIAAARQRSATWARGKLAAAREKVTAAVDLGKAA
jgi:RNA polymerase sigma factor (sigma-70 family)